MLAYLVPPVSSVITLIETSMILNTAYLRPSSSTHRQADFLQITLEIDLGLLNKDFRFPFISRLAVVVNQNSMIG